MKLLAKIAVQPEPQSRPTETKEVSLSAGKIRAMQEIG